MTKDIETELTERERAIRRRILNAERQRRYKERHATKQRPISLMLDRQIDWSLNVLCVHNGCDRKTMVEALINNAFVDIARGMKLADYEALENETLARSTSKHRALPK